MHFICARCESEYDAKPEVCGACLSRDALLPLPSRVGGRDVAIVPRPRVGVVAASALRAEGRLAPFGPPFDLWKLGDPFAAELLGHPGSGKSTLAARMAVAYARRADVLLVAAEEGPSATLRDRLRRSGLDDMTAARLRVSDARNVTELVEDLERDSARLVVLDSVTEIGAAPEHVAASLLGRSWIAVSHVNQRGQSYGGQTMSHAVDVVVRVEHGIATPTKNRFGPMDPIAVFDQEAA